MAQFTIINIKQQYDNNFIYTAVNTDKIILITPVTNEEFIKNRMYTMITISLVNNDVEIYYTNELMERLVSRINNSEIEPL